jgi:hypothetical protein
MFFKFIKHFLQMMHVIPWSKAKNINIIDVVIGKTKVHLNPIYNS